MSLSSTFDLENDDGLRRLVYTSAFLLIFLPHFQALAGLWPLQLGSLQWRFQATGQMAGILMLPFLGFVLALAVARPLGQKGISRLIGIAAALTALAVLVAIGLFAMDALQLKKVVRDVQMAQFNKAVFISTTAMLISLVTYTMLAVVAMRSPAGSSMKASPKSTKKSVPDENVGLLIGQNYTKE